MAIGIPLGKMTNKLFKLFIYPLRRIKQQLEYKHICHVQVMREE